MSQPVLVGVGMGPGDPDLVTIGGVRRLETADVVVVPVLDLAEMGRAEATVWAHITHGRVERVVFALNERTDRTRRENAWDAAADVIAGHFTAGRDIVAFATIGDPNVYATFGYLAQGVRDRVPGVRIETVPGITAMQDLASRSGTVLCEGTEVLTLIPGTAGMDALRAALVGTDPVVVYKIGDRLTAVIELLDQAGRLSGAVLGERLGLPDELIHPLDLTAGPAPYLATLLVPGLRATRGGKL